MQNSKLILRNFLLGSCCTSTKKKSVSNAIFSNKNNSPLFGLPLFFLNSNETSFVAKRRGFCGYAVEQFSDDEYECDFESHKASSSVANVDEWKWKLSLLLRSETDQEIVSKDRKDRRDYEQISNLARRMGLYSELYGKVVVASKVPLPNYRSDLDDKRPQREVVIPLSLQRRVEGLLQEHLYRAQLKAENVDGSADDAKSIDQTEDISLDENKDSFLDRSVMERVLQRRSLQMRNMQRAWYVGRLFVKGSGKPLEILTKLNEMAGFAPDQEIALYEEIKFEPNVMCEPIDKRLTFRSSQLEDGDIVCFQKPPQMGSNEQCRYPDVPSFLEYMHNRQVVRFRSLEKSKEDEFCLELSKLHTYDDVVERVANHLGLDDPSKIRLTSHNCYSQQPKPQPIKYRGVDHLSDMLVHYNQTSDILYYEVLDIPLPELQGLKTLKVAFHHATKDEVVIHTIRLPKQSTVGDVINDLKTKVELSHPSAELRLLEVFYHKIYKIFPHNEKIENINDQYWTLRAEEIPEEEKNLGPHDRLIHVYHFMKDTTQNQVVQNFGEPFFLVIHEGEALADVKMRVQRKLQVPDEEFSKWKFAFLSLGRPEYLQDSDIVSNRFQRRDIYGAWEQYLGLEHSDNAPKRSYAANQNRHTFEKPVKIYN